MGAQPYLSQQRLLGKKLDSTLFLVINRIYRVLWIQDHRCRPEPPKIPVKFFTTRLLRRVRESIRECALEDPPNLDIDWECRVLRPVIATLDLTGIMDVCETDAEYILLLSTTLHPSPFYYILRTRCYCLIPTLSLQAPPTPSTLLLASSSSSHPRLFRSSLLRSYIIILETQT